jgi:hypothetical protein
VRAVRRAHRRCVTTCVCVAAQDAETTGGAEGARTLDNAWHGAEAIHFLLLAHRQLYAGNVDGAYVV